MKILLIVAAGKSSRFGGFPKAFCKIGDKSVIENTIQKAIPFFDSIYVGVNRSIYAEYNNKIAGCKMFSIVTGQGDAHSLLKCLTYIKNDIKDSEIVDDLVFCWGDAFFVNSIPFEQFCDCNSSTSRVEVACSYDSNPYAWFDVEDGDIVNAHFAKEGEQVEVGVHDQCLFRINLDFGIYYLNLYRESLNIPFDNDEEMADKNEMKLLNSFKFLLEKEKEGAKVVMIDSGNILSFNTKEELKKIKDIQNSKSEDYLNV